MPCAEYIACVDDLPCDSQNCRRCLQIACATRHPAVLTQHGHVCSLKAHAGWRSFCTVICAFLDFRTRPNYYSWNRGVVAGHSLPSALQRDVEIPERATIFVA